MSDLAHHGLPFQGSLQKKHENVRVSGTLSWRGLGGKTVFNSVM